MSFEVKSIFKKYGKKNILNGVSLTIGQGECVGLLGANGSGKSTLLSILAEIQPADGGEFLYNGAALPTRKHREFVGYVPQGTPLFEELSARDNLLLWYSKCKLNESLDNGALKLLGIDKFIDMRVSKLSGGMKKRLSIGCSVSGHSKLLLLDEPCAALDLPARRDISDYILNFKKNGGSAILATHDISEITLCDRLYILKNGIAEPYEFDGNIEKLAEKLK